MADRVRKLHELFSVDEDSTGQNPVLYQLERVTKTQVKEFLVCCRNKFMRAKIEPG